jgi:hypothetical protein
MEGSRKDSRWPYSARRRNDTIKNATSFCAYFAALTCKTENKQERVVAGHELTVTLGKFDHSGPH